MFERWSLLEDEPSELDVEYLRSKKIDPFDESQLLEIVRSKPMSLKGNSAFRMLRTRGVATARSIPVCKELCLDRHSDIQSEALVVLDGIAGASEIAFYRRLARTKQQCKHFLFDQSWTIGRWGDASDVPAAAKILRRRYSRRVKSDWMGTSTPLSCLLRFLVEFAEDPVARQAMSWIRERWQTLPKGERHAAELTLPEFSEIGEARWVAVVGTPNPWADGMVSHDPEIYMSIPVDVTHPRFVRHAVRAARYASLIVVVEPGVEAFDEIRSAFPRNVKTVLACNPGIQWSPRAGGPWRAAVEAARQKVCAALSG
jgi:hypothetical protein